MNNVKVWIDLKAVKERILTSPEMNAVLMEAATNLAAQAGDGYEARLLTRSSRSAARVEAVTETAKKDNLENNTLLILVS